MVVQEIQLFSYKMDTGLILSNKIMNGTSCIISFVLVFFFYSFFVVTPKQLDIFDIWSFKMK